MKKRDYILEWIFYVSFVLYVPFGIVCGIISLCTGKVIEGIFSLAVSLFGCFIIAYCYKQIKKYQQNEKNKTQ